MQVRSKTARSLAPALIGLALVAAACGGGDGSPGETPTQASPDAASAQIRVGDTDLSLGPNRMVLAVLDGVGSPIGESDVRLRFYHLDGADPAVVKSETVARFLGRQTQAAQALHSTRVSFDAVGLWAVEATIRRGAGEALTARTQFRIKTNSDTPNIGDLAPATVNDTLSTSPIERLTSQRPTGDPAFYRLTIAEALELPKPLLIVFSTPAFCQTRTCGPQLEAAQALAERYGDRMSFIHIEIFERPDLLLTNEVDPTTRAAVRDWRLQTEPMTYLIDAAGKVADRFEGFAPADELEESIAAVLAS